MVGKDAKHWDEFYAEHATVFRGRWYQPTLFARTWRDRLPRTCSILDLGCGNGRDSVYLAAEAHREVLGVDASEDAVRLGRAFAAFCGRHCSFECADFTQLDTAFANYEVAYLRFVMHAITTAEQQRLLATLADKLPPPGIVLIEARRTSAHMPGHLETYNGHYRRLLHPATFRGELEDAGFRIWHFEEATGEPFEGDEPPVLQVAACTSDTWSLGDT